MPKYNKLYFFTNNTAYILGTVIDVSIFICIRCIVKELPDIQEIILNDGFGGKATGIYIRSTENNLIQFKLYYIQIYSSVTQITDFPGLPLKIFGIT